MAGIVDADTDVGEGRELLAVLIERFRDTNRFTPEGVLADAGNEDIDRMVFFPSAA